MKVFAQKMTRWFLKEGIVDPERAEWCVYVIESRVFTLISLSLVILIGVALFPIEDVLLLNFGVAFLRKKTSGLHLKSALSCCFFSILSELACLLLLPYFRGPVTLVVLVLSVLVIIKLAPFNNSEMHFEKAELTALKNEICRRLILYIGLILLLLKMSPTFAFSLIFAMAYVALLLVLAKLGVGCQ